MVILQRNIKIRPIPGFVSNDFIIETTTTQWHKRIEKFKDNPKLEMGGSVMKLLENAAERENNEKKYVDKHWVDGASLRLDSMEKSRTWRSVMNDISLVTGAHDVMEIINQITDNSEVMEKLFDEGKKIIIGIVIDDHGDNFFITVGYARHKITIVHSVEVTATYAHPDSPIHKGAYIMSLDGKQKE